MKIIISESKIESLIYNFLEENYLPDGGFEGYYGRENPRVYIAYQNGEPIWSFHLNESMSIPANTLKLGDLSIFKTLRGYFGNMWPPVMKRWVENHLRGVKINKIIGPDYEGIAEF
jgi:hypothetical protein